MKKKGSFNKHSLSSILSFSLPQKIDKKTNSFSKIIYAEVRKNKKQLTRAKKSFVKQYFSYLKSSKRVLKKKYRQNRKYIKPVMPVFLLLQKIFLFFFSIIRHLFTKKNKSHAGRPRSRPLFIYLLKYKFNPQLKFLNNLVPSPIRITIFLSLVVLAVVLYSSFLILMARELPSPTKLSDTSGPLTTTFYDRNGNVLYRMYEDKNRTLVKLNDLPPSLVQATLSIEDKNFYNHRGIDFGGIIRAAYQTFINKEDMQSGSTITQQLIKNTLLTPEKTFDRKIKEVILSLWTELVFTKPEILQMYFNEVPYGGTSWGIAAASETYFNKDPKELDLAEASYLAGLPASPTTYSPYGTNPELGKVRQGEVLKRMVEEKYITEDQAKTAYAEQLNIQPPVSQIKAPHFVMYVKQQLVNKYGEKMVAQGGFQVYTTLDLNIQEMAEKAVQEEVAKDAYLKISNGAAMVTDPSTGQILAMVGSKNYWDPNNGNFNVTTAPRQPGSSIKPITYATGFNIGYTPGNIILDTPTNFGGYAPVNYDGRFHGAVTIREALGSSLNIPAVKMLSIVGVPNMIQTAHNLGITTINDSPDKYGLSLTLGSGEIKMIDMMSVYGTFSQLGIKHDIQPVLKITDATGNTIEDHTNPQGIRVLDAGVAYMITDVLSDNKARTMEFGPNSPLNIPGYTVGVKTGTTDWKKDNWTFGYTPKYAVGVWVGNNDNSPMDQRLASGITGAAPIWNRIMTNLLAGSQNIAFERPDNIYETTIDGHKDLAVRNLNTKSLVRFDYQPNNKDKNNGEAKDSITFTDPFSSVTLDQPANQ